jgi:hypothetical protein
MMCINTYSLVERVEILAIKARTKFLIIYSVIINHSHESKDRILPQRVFTLPD